MWSRRGRRKWNESSCFCNNEQSKFFRWRIFKSLSEDGSIRNIIFQPGQFDCASETLLGEYNPQNIYNMTPTDVHYNIADWAMAGNRLNEVGECLWYLNPFRPNCSSTFPSNGSGTFHTRLGEHCFYRPTSSYADT